MLRDRIAFPFLFFSCFFFYFINTQNCPLRNVSFGYTLYVLLIGILPMSSSISLNKKELYEEHVQNSYSNRKDSNKLYQGSYKKTSHLKLSLERRYSKIQST